MPRSTPALSKALSFIKDNLQNPSWQSSCRLPSIRELARTAGVSVVTMWKAVHILTQQGLLSAAPKKGIVIAGNEKSEDSPPFRGYARDRTAAHIRHDILEGSFITQDQFPSSKELLIRYGVCRKTLHHALRTLEQQRIIRRYGRWYRLFHDTIHRGISRIAFVSGSIRRARIHVYNDRILRFIETLEKECIRTNVMYEPLGYAFGKKIQPEKIHTNRENRLGYIFWIGPWISKWNGAAAEVTAMVDSASRQGMPVAIFDEIGSTAIPRNIAARPNVGLFTISAYRAGEEVGNMLIRAGYRSAYFCFQQPLRIWSQRRLEGLRTAFRKAGLPSAIALGCFYAPPQKSPETLPQNRDGLPTTFHNRFSHMLKDISVRAWIGENDGLTLQAMNFLISQGIEPGSEISLVGFDNHELTIAHRITTYDFDLPGIMRRLFSFVVYPWRERKKNPSYFQEVPGILIKRESVTPSST